MLSLLDRREQALVRLMITEEAKNCSYLMVAQILQIRHAEACEFLWKPNLY